MMTENLKKDCAFGLWPSPLSATAAGQKLRFEDVQFDPTGNSIIWVEGRSNSGVLVRQPNGYARRDLTSTGQSVRGGIGYGGGEFTCAADSVIYAEKGGQLFKLGLDSGLPVCLTPPFGAYADPQISPDGKWVLAVFSDGKTDLLSLIPADGKDWPVQLVRGADFYSSPRWHPGGKSFTWMEWNHPNMPWEGTRLMLGRLEGNPPRLVGSHLIAGDINTPALEPQFSPDGKFLSYLISNGEWEDLVLLELQTGQSRVLIKGDGFHLTQPAWVQGIRSYGWVYDNQEIITIQNRGGNSTLWRVEIERGETVQIETTPYTWITQLHVSPVTTDLVFLGSAPGIPTRVLKRSGNQIQTIAYSDAERLPSSYYSDAVPLEWAAPDGTLVYGTFYAPCNPEFSSNGLPPAIIYIHGGPTSEQPVTYSSERTYFTSRGYAWLDVNYRGSSGQGKTYMNALRSNWGLFDREDAAGGANALISRGLADPKRLIIRGGSAGGYTVLNSLIHYPGLFKAGICLYGVSNLFTLAQDTHKFEARYNDSLVGTLPEASDKYHNWSPIFHASQINDALAIFQGSIDKVVPPSQSEEIVNVLKPKGIPLLYKLYEGEGHGFRKDETLTNFYSEVERFLQQFVLFAP
jgi:dipeptidyl aminopeptidase/acylaminoacyl peptidase